MLLKEHYVNKMLNRLARETYRRLQILSLHNLKEVAHTCGPIEGYNIKSTHSFPIRVPFSSTLPQLCVLIIQFVKALNQLSAASNMEPILGSTLRMYLESFIVSNYLGFVRASLQERSLLELFRLQRNVAQLEIFVRSILTPYVIKKEKRLAQDLDILQLRILEVAKETQIDIDQCINNLLKESIHQAIYYMIDDLDRRSFEEPSISPYCAMLVNSMKDMMTSLENLEEEDKVPILTTLCDRMLEIMVYSLAHDYVLDKVSEMAYQKGWSVYMNILLDVQSIEMNLGPMFEAIQHKQNIPVFFSKTNPSYQSLLELLEFLHVLISDTPAEYLNPSFKEKRYPYLQSSTLLSWLNM
jgi:hypothetical protein